MKGKSCDKLACFIKSQSKIYSAFTVSLLLWATFLPSLAQAGFFDSFFGNEALADITDSISSPVVQVTENSQTISILEADASSTLALLSKQDQTNEDMVSIISENALLPAPDLMIISGEAESGGPDSDQISVYVVRTGDSISEIAEMFDVSVNTILWANDLKKNDTIKEGDILFILPISGVEHVITKGQTLQGIAKLYKADSVDIARFNGITETASLAIGDKIIIPGGELYNENTSTSIPSKSSVYYTTTANINTPGYFINPVPAFSRRSQGLHGPGKRGIDLAAPTGTPVLASAGGTVLLARAGWNGAYGNMVILIHPNGTKTLYAHLSKVAITTGAKVSQGDLIGYVGSTGRSTGPHLHFEVFNAKNPGATTPMSFATR